MRTSNEIDSIKGNFKVHEKSAFELLGFNRYGVAAGALETVDAAVSGASGSLNGFWNEDGTGFQHAMNGIGGVASGAFNIGVGVAFGLATHHGIRSIIGDTASSLLRRPKFQYLEAVKHNGNVFTKMADDSIMRLGSPKSIINKIVHQEEKAAAFVHGTKGVWRTSSLENAAAGGGRFIRNSRLFSGWGLVLGVGAQILAPMAIGAVTGVAGQLMDEAHMAYMQSTYHQYDTREFNNRAMQSWEFSKQNQLQSNLIPYEQNNMSLARLYYSR